MDEYIEFEATKQAIDRIRSVYHRARNYNAVSAIDNVFGEIKEIPAADVAPVVRGHWIKRRYGLRKIYYHCSHCHLGLSKIGDDNYCPYCGAKMDEN